MKSNLSIFFISESCFWYCIYELCLNQGHKDLAFLLGVPSFQVLVHVVCMILHFAFFSFKSFLKNFKSMEKLKE